MEDNKVAVLLEDLRAQFRNFGEGLQIVNDKIDKVDQKVVNLQQEVRTLRDEVIGIKFDLKEHKTDNQREHQQIIQAVKELDTEVVTLQRVK
jgi:predicted  nucleic acid-binding Zn-ribbon protein